MGVRDLVFRLWDSGVANANGASTWAVAVGAPLGECCRGMQGPVAMVTACCPVLLV